MLRGPEELRVVAVLNEELILVVYMAEEAEDKGPVIAVAVALRLASFSILVAQIFDHDVFVSASLANSGSGPVLC
ncbi:uncharacterized protein A4U43_C10F6770 [Asparagus officinalis]|uniref:Uncharacterized protein n=1 Tax=Asparagus officinalis TaxID=4686 RepID=A0A5P1E1M4_ASPOF|nr:uncharacterized protein A4U43_C10F6770 [Asparagus officinalis]